MHPALTPTAPQIHQSWFCLAFFVANIAHCNDWQVTYGINIDLIMCERNETTVLRTSNPVVFHGLITRQCDSFTFQFLISLLDAATVSADSARVAIKTVNVQEQRLANTAKVCLQ